MIISKSLLPFLAMSSLLGNYLFLSFQPFPINRYTAIKLDIWMLRYICFTLWRQLRPSSGTVGKWCSSLVSFSGFYSVSLHEKITSMPRLLFEGNVRISVVHPEVYQYYGIFERRFYKMCTRIGFSTSTYRLTTYTINTFQQKLIFN